MPRSGGTYSAPPGAKGAPNTTIESAKYNAFVDDIVDEQNGKRPVGSGGTGANTAVGGNDNLTTAGNSMASAATVNLANATGVALTITGTVAITSFGIVGAGAQRVLTFASALTLTYNATSMILPGGKDIVTEAGDVAEMRSLGGGNWQCVNYQRAAAPPYSTTSTETLKNKSFDDATTAFVDDADPTKKVKLQVGGVTTATTRTLTVPDADGTILTNTRQQLVAGFRNLKVQATSASAAAVTADALTVEDSTGGCVRLTNVNVSADLATAGLGGLDTGAEAANTWYYPWVIWDGANIRSILSASPTAPTMPAGYTHKARVGSLRNDASSNLWRTLQIGRRVQVTIGTNPVASPVIISGNSGSPTTPTWTAVAVGAFVPPTAVSIRGTMLMAQSDSTRAMLAPNNSYGAWNAANAAPVGNGNNGITGSFLITTIQFDLMLESTNIYYASSNGSTNVLLNGWEENL
jgi:hypothetical protein